MFPANGSVLNRLLIRCNQCIVQLMKWRMFDRMDFKTVLCGEKDVGRIVSAFHLQYCTKGTNLIMRVPSMVNWTVFTLK